MNQTFTKNIKQYIVFLVLFFLYSEAFAYRLKDEDVIVLGGVITSCIYDISTKGNVIEIPDILDGQTITGIGNYAFSVAGKIAVLTLPSTLKTIGDGVFEGHALTSLVIPGGVISIGRRAFYGNALASINLPVGLLSIADETFANNQLTGITLPAGLKTIGWGAFQNNKITSLIIPNSLETIGWQAFSNNKISVLNFQATCKLKEISGWCFSNNDIKTLTIPNSVLIISDGAFQNNANLSNIVFSPNLLKIKMSAFNSCNLSAINLPESLVFIGKYAFEGNINLNSINLPVSAKNYRWNDSNGAKHNGGDIVTEKYFSYVAIMPYTLKDEDVVVLNGIITNCSYFNDITNIASIITIPDNLDGQNIIGIAESTFYNRGISEIILPKGLKNIGNNAFSNNDLIHLTLPNSLETIGEYAFSWNCINTLSFETTSKVEKIGIWAFSGNRLVQIDFPKSVMNIEKNAFESNSLQKINFENNSRLMSIGSGAFRYNQQLTNFTLPDPKINGYNYWFDWDNKEYSSNLIVNSFESFYKIPIVYTLTDADVVVIDGIIVSCKLNNLNANIITIPDNLDGQKITGIGERVFQRMGLIGINLPSTLKTIGYGAFAENEILKVKIPQSVEDIKGEAFWRNNINELTFEVNSLLKFIGGWAFYNNKITKLDFPEKLNHIDYGAFHYNKLSNEIIIPDSVKYIGGYAFSFNYEITKLTFGENSKLSFLGERAFENNKISNEIFIPKTLTEISDYAFQNNKISKVITHEAFVDYGNGAFQNNDPSLKIVLHKPPTIPNVTHFFWWKDNDDNHLLPGDIITDFSKRYKAVIDQFFVVKFVVKDDNKVPVENASIQFYGDILTTKKNGIDSIGPVMRGLQKYKVSAPGCYDFEGSVDVQDNMIVPVTLVKYYKVTITVVDVNNNPIPGADIKINSSTLPSDASGKININLPDGSYPFAIKAIGFNENSSSITVLDSDNSIIVKLIRVLINYFPNQGTGVSFADITFGSSYSAKNNSFTRTAYTFSNWNTNANNSGSKYAENESIPLTYSHIDLYAIWKPVDYNIIYHLDGGTNNPGNPLKYNIESELIFLPANKTLLYFAAWLDANKKRVEKIEKGNTGDIELWAVFTAEPTYYIDYYNLENATHKNQASYTKFDLPMLFTGAYKKGYDFTGWYEDNLLTKQISTIPTDSKKDYKVYAKWGGATNYAITYNLDKGLNHLANPANYTIESKAINFESPTKTGAKFIAWYSDKNLTKKITGIPTGSLGDTVIFAKWELASFNIQYVLDGGKNHLANPANFTIESKPINFESPTKTGTKFIAWFSDKALTKKITGIPTGTIGDTTIYAKWELVSFDIQYALEGGKNHPENPENYTIESKPINFESPAKTGAAFAGWYSDKNLTKKITGIPTGSIGDTAIFAKWDLAIFNIQYVLEGGKNHSANPENYTIESKPINFESPAKTGAAFAGWFSDKNLTKKITGIPTGSIGDTTVYAKWELNGFQIDYVLNGGINNTNNPLFYTIASNHINFESPTKTGAKFIAWYSDKNLTKKIAGIPTGSIGDTTIFAKWDLVSFDIQYVLEGGKNHPANPANFTIESNPINFESPTKTGTKFIAWFSDKALTKKIAGIPTGSIGDTTIYAKWELVSFDIKYALNGGKNHPANPANYTIESNPINFESPSKTGAAFAGWYSDMALTKKIAGIPTGSLGDTAIFAKWELAIFNIQYVLDGGKNHLANPANFTIESKPINFESPSKAGAAFVGWFSDKNLTKKIAGIPTGSIGDTAIFAKWELNGFQIDYVLNGGINNTNNPLFYTIASKPINFESPTKTGAAFAGWYSDMALTKKITGIPTGSIGDIAIFAKWELAIFNIQYVLEEGENHPANPANYTVMSKPINFESPSKTGAKFIAWFSDSGLTKKITGIPMGSIGDTTVYAKWELIIFDIQYELDGGKNHTANPANYSIMSNPINFEFPSKTGASFVGWYSDKALTKKITGIPTGSIGDTAIFAKWELAIFNIQYVLDGGKNHPANPAFYTIESNTIILRNPDRSGYIFDGWFTNSNYSNSIKSVPKGSEGDISIYAKWIELFDVNFFITTDGINPAKDIDIVINTTQKLKSDIFGFAGTIMLDGNSFDYSVEINGIVIDVGFVTIKGSDVTIKVEIVNCYIRWYDVLFCDNGKGLWNDFVWYKDNIRISDEQFFHNPGGIKGGEYRLAVTSIAGVEYIWEKEYKTNESREQESKSEIFELNVFPNPITKNNKLKIILSENINLQTSGIAIYGVNGVLIKKIDNPLHMNEIYIDSNFSSGVYHITLSDEKNKRRTVQNFIVY